MKCSMVIAKLFTKEDRHYLHKILGLFSVISFVYRYFVVYPKKGNLGFGNDLFSWISMFLHLALSTSSLIFHVLLKRIVNKPMVIWKEYQLHAIVFTVRCFSVFAYAVLTPIYLPQLRGTNMELFGLCAFVMAHHLVVDWISRNFGTPEQTTVRVKDDSGFAIKIAKRFYSFYQFLAVASHILPNERLADLGFNTLIAIQSSAFLMTLFRKGVIEWYTHAAWYTTCLAISSFHILRLVPSDEMWWFLAKVCLVFFIRVRYNVSKYYLWALFAISFSPIYTAFLAEQTASASQLISNSPLGPQLADLSVRLSDFGKMEFSGFDFSVSSTNSRVVMGLLLLLTVTAGHGYANLFSFFTKTKATEPKSSSVDKKMAKTEGEAKVEPATPSPVNPISA